MKRMSVVGWLAIGVITVVISWWLGDYILPHGNFKLMYISENGTKKCESKLFFDECHPYEQINPCPEMERLARIARGEEEKTCWLDNGQGTWYFDPNCLKTNR